QKGCGQGVLAKYLSGTQFVRVTLKHRPASDFQVGEQIELGIEESAMLRAAFLAYLVPLLLLVAGASIGNQFSEPFAILLGLAGLIIGGIYVRKESLKKVDDPRYAPVVVDDRAVVKILPGEPA
ncbi:MAG: SoxR reducing system RseC family protein, partial [Pseudomonadales bacterium]